MHIFYKFLSRFIVESVQVKQKLHRKQRFAVLVAFAPPGRTRKEAPKSPAKGRAWNEEGEAAGGTEAFGARLGLRICRASAWRKTPAHLTPVPLYFVYSLQRPRAAVGYRQGASPFAGTNGGYCTHMSAGLDLDFGP